jgi:hypothetical protein
VMTRQPEQCECDRDVHASTRCRNAATHHGSVQTSPALCAYCLWNCWAGEEGMQRGKGAEE